jgi:hypothetical protein
MSTWQTQAEAEVTLLKADNKTGYFGVYHQPAGTSPTRRR